jgi:hypothetical protein
MVAATGAALAGSLALDALLVALGTRLFPSTRGYVHFRFSDYGLLTVIGVLVACGAWPLTTRLSSAPRWLFLRVAVVVTLVLWLPDVWILSQGQPPRAVAVLIVMHLAIALCTYNLLVRLAPVRPSLAVTPVRSGVAPGPPPGPPSRDRWLSSDRARRAGLALGGLVGLELLFGVAAVVLVPYDRPLTWIPAPGRLVYLVHAGVGGVLGIGAVAVVLGARRAAPVARQGSVTGLVGVVIAGLGGLACVAHPTRLLGVALMLVGTMVAGFGYLMMVIEVAPREPTPDPSGSPAP